MNSVVGWLGRSGYQAVYVCSVEDCHYAIGVTLDEELQRPFCDKHRPPGRTQETKV